MKLPLLLALVPCAVFAQNFQAVPRLKPILPRLDQPWTKTQPMGKLAMLGAALPPQGTVQPSKICSIPLLVVTPRDVDPHMIILTPGDVEPNMPQVQPPAPPCPTRPSR